MAAGAAPHSEALGHGRPHPGRWLLFILLITVSLACKAAQGDLRATPTPLAAALLTPATPSQPGAPLKPSAPAPAAIPDTGSASPTSEPPMATLPVVEPGVTPPGATQPNAPEPSAIPPDGAQPGATSLAPALPAPPFPSPQPVGGDPQVTARQLRVFEEIWGVVRDRYLYPDFNGRDWNAIGQEYRERIQAGMGDEDFYRAMREMIVRLGDEHSNYFSPEEAARSDQEFQGQSSFVGIGVAWTAIPERRRLAVVLVFPGSPAEEAGIRVHDSILAVDGQPVMDAGGQVQNILRGPEGSTAQVTVQSPGQEPRQVALTRRAVAQQMPVSRQALQSPAGKRIGYIDIPTFSEANIDDEVGEALSELGNAGMLSGVILDNRFNRGGQSEVLLNTLSYFVDGTLGYFIENRNHIPLTVRGQDVIGSQSVPLVVLIGHDTISFGEVFSGALKDLGRAHLIGMPTEGNVEVLSIFNFSDGSRAWIATSSFRPLRDPNQNWEQSGILPDEAVATAWDQVTFESDPAILAALRYFDSLAASP